MRTRKYIVVIVLSWILLLSWGIYWIRETPRMEATAMAFKEELVTQGAQLYAENCVICHGPLGEGVVGPNLNRAEIRGDPVNDQEKFDFVYKTVSQGRPGSVVTRWQRLPSGEWASLSQMPAWSNQNGGPFNEHQLRAITYFVLDGNWNDINAHIPPAKTEGELPAPSTLPPERVQQAQAIIRQKGCLVCHTIGSTGGKIGPDLTHVGSWGVDREFLSSWIRNPLAMQQQNRAPVWFSNHAGIDAQGKPSGVRIAYGPTQMPQLPFTQQELDVLVDYLLHLK